MKRLLLLAIPNKLRRVWIQSANTIPWKSWNIFWLLAVLIARILLYIAEDMYYIYKDSLCY